MDVKLNNGFTEFKFDINRIVNKESEECPKIGYKHKTSETIVW